jgi:hypothetical protein
MQLNITIKDKLIKQTIGDIVENCIFDQYDAAVIKRAGVGKRADVINKIFADPKFIDQFTKQIINYIEDGDLFYDFIVETHGTVLDKLGAACDDVCEAIEREEYEKEEAFRAKHAKAREAEEKKRKEAEEEATVARVITALKKQGYSITKE